MQSLTEARACGQVHRDIKPANVFLCRYGQDFDFVKVLDFGLVKALDGRGEGRAGRTAENMVQDTPAFIAHINTAPIAPSARAAQAIPPALDSLILSCLAKDPSARPQTARELSGRLAEIGDADPWTEESARVWWERYCVQS